MKIIRNLCDKHDLEFYISGGFNWVGEYWEYEARFNKIGACRECGKKFWYCAESHEDILNKLIKALRCYPNSSSED